MSVAARSGRAPVPAELVRDLGAELCRRLWRGDGAQLARAPEICELIARCDDEGRRDELGRFVAAVEALPEAHRRDFAVAMHPVQLRSKLWLVDELAARHDLRDSTLVAYGAWYGALALLAHWRLAAPPRRVICVDLDAAVCELGAATVGALCSGVEFCVGDMLELDLAALGSPPSPVIVNTSCEHVPGLRDWWEQVPAGQLAALQSNNHRHCSDHVNCVDSVEELKLQLPMSTVLYEGVRHLTDEGLLGGRPDLDRFMVIGVR